MKRTIYIWLALSSMMIMSCGSDEEKEELTACSCIKDLDAMEMKMGGVRSLGRNL